MSIPLKTTTKTGTGEAVPSSGLQFNALSGPGSSGDVDVILMLTNKRNAQIQEFEMKKKKIEADTQKSVLLNDRFTTYNEDHDERLQKHTYGLITHKQFKETQQHLAQVEANKALNEQIEKKKILEKSQQSLRKLTNKNKLSFHTDEEEEDESDAADDFLFPEITKQKRTHSTITKDPSSKLDVLPDEQKELERAAEIARLTREYDETVAREKKERIDVVYSLWDGTGHRQSMVVTKGTTIGEFLNMAIQTDEARKMRFARHGTGNDVLFVKEDIILPHNISFHDLIATNARGKSGPLYNWGVHEDVRMLHDARVEKDESHAAKVVERQWYEHNKHIFPINRWEEFDPKKNYETYTIHDKLKEKREREKQEMAEIEQEQLRMRILGK
ncbi:putative Protein FAM50 like protein [Blattamonas nauphoetae]|uniref:FAM50A/XAP5 C-terminal domain-containing protein n=1 Tax=Blattamonas nauphoetae TaxID=2049346 RepID=A0ABQ9YEM1_9EUKA|nr:putative Protein FAM50 like protein [Blattamonas nauphoetae]